MIYNVDPRNQTIYILAEDAKDRSGRSIPVSTNVIKEIRNLYLDSCGYFEEQDRIFLNTYGDPFNAGAFRKRLNCLIGFIIE